jgi:hypothetical protein
MSIIYGSVYYPLYGCVNAHGYPRTRTLYLLFAAFPIVYEQERGWSVGVGGLAFIGKYDAAMPTQIGSELKNLSQALLLDLCWVSSSTCKHRTFPLRETLCHT